MTSIRHNPETTQTVVETELTVLNRLGLHALPATGFVKCAAQFKSALKLSAKGQDYSAHRVFDVLSARLAAGERFKLVAKGPDAARAARALERYLQRLAELEQRVDGALGGPVFRRPDPLED